METTQEKSNIKEIKGRAKSGRFWKTSKKRYSSIKADKPLKSSWTKKMKHKLEMKSMKTYERELKEAKLKAIEEKKQRREENKRRREENAKKAEIVQPIKNTAKLKKMSRKQLRAIQKR